MFPSSKYQQKNISYFYYISILQWNFQKKILSGYYRSNLSLSNVETHISLTFVVIVMALFRAFVCQRSSAFPKSRMRFYCMNVQKVCILTQGWVLQVGCERASMDCMGFLCGMTIEWDCCQFCSEHKLTATSRRFQLRTMSKKSGMHSRSKQWHLRDYIIAWQKEIADVQITRAMMKVDGWTTHRMVGSILKLRIKPLVRRVVSKKEMWGHYFRKSNASYVLQI